MSNYTEICTGVPVLDVPTENLKNCIERFTITKDWLDRMSRSWSGRQIIMALGLQDGYYGTINPITYALDLLPFYKFSRCAKVGEIRKSYKALVPVELVIGESWNWRPEDISEEGQSQIIEASLADFATSDEGSARGACADYTFIKPLGVVLAHEGKNRVALFRERALSYIPAVVHEDDYPSADQIRIFDLPDVCLAVFENRRVERVQSLPLIQDLMEAYGINIEKKWPDDYAPLQAVLDGFSDHRFQDQVYGTRVDMRAVARDEAILESEVRADLHSIDGVQPLPWTAVASLAVLVLLCVFGVSILLPSPDLRTTVAVLLMGLAGTAMAFVCTPFLPVVSCKVRRLRERERWDYLHAGRRQMEDAGEKERKIRMV